MALADTPLSVTDHPGLEHDHPEAPARGRRRWRRNLGTWIPAGMVAFVVLACFLGPIVLNLPAPTGGDVLDSYLPALSPGHPLGTDPNGNDILSRLLYGGRASLFIATAVNVLGLVVGGTLGALSGYAAGTLDTVIMRLLDVLIAFPSLVLILAVAQALGPSITNTILALAFFSIPAFARVVPLGRAPAARAALHGGGKDLRDVDLADAVQAPRAQHRAPADHLRDARHGHRDHHRRCAELPRPGCA